MISVQLCYAAAQTLRLTASGFRAPGARLLVELTAAPSRAPAAPADPVQLAQSLAAPLPSGPGAPALAPTEAARGFSEGTFYLPGERIDRYA